MDDELEQFLALPLHLQQQIISELPGDAAAEILAEINALTAISKLPANPLAQARELDPGYRQRDYLEHLSERIALAVRDVENGYERRLIVSMPPRSGKSQLTSVYLPVWLLRKHPEWRVAVISHESTLAVNWGRQVRRIITSNPELGIQLASDLKAAGEWQVVEGGGVLARSVRGSLTGRGAKVMLVDDPHKDFAEVHSAASRDAVWDWWTSVALTRLEPPSLVVVLATRWHEDDLLGRLLERDDGTWEQIRFPAIAEEQDALGRAPGDPLLSPLLDETRDGALTRWAEVRQAVGEYAWAGLYQQQPSPASGAIFKRDHWVLYEEAPPEHEYDRLLTSWDCAFKGNDDSDYVVGQLWGSRGADRYLIDQVRGQWTFTETLNQMRTFCGRHNATEHIVEDKANGTAILDVLRREISGMVAVSPKDAKEVRARAITPQVEAGNVHLPARAHFTQELLAELTAFPGGKHDDAVDALTQALSRLTSQGVVTSYVPGRAATVQRAYAGRRR